MSRIRSIHPGLATDEAYMALSHAAARVLPLLWCECDDQGVFEWKPLTLKARILPAHPDDMVKILEELESNGFVNHFEIGDKHYGAVRNFARYQHPKFPKAVHPMPEWLRNYVGSSPPPTVGDGVEDTPPAVGTTDQLVVLPHGVGDGVKEGVKKKKDYIFDGAVVKLTAADFARWQKNFSAIGEALRGLLEGRDAWLQTQDASAKRKWFQSTASWLANKNTEAVERARAGNVTPHGRAWA